MEAAAQSGPPAWFIAILVVMGLGVVAFFGVLVKRARGGGAEVVCGGCGRVMMPGWPTCKFCGAAAPTGVVQSAPVQKSAPAKKQMGPPELHFISGPMQGKIFRLDIDVTTIGSAQGNTIIITDTGISKRHVGIKKEGSAFERADLGSTNGVYVNGQKVARRPLIPGDVIRVGVTEMVFRS